MVDAQAALPHAHDLAQHVQNAIQHAIPPENNALLNENVVQPQPVQQPHIGQHEGQQNAGVTLSKSLFGYSAIDPGGN